MYKKVITILLFALLSINNPLAQTWESFTSENSGLPDNMVNSIAISYDSTLWFATQNGLASFKKNIWNVFKTDDGLKTNKVNSISFLPLNTNKLWLSTDLGAIILSVDSSGGISNPEYISTAENTIVSDTITVIALDSLSNNWIGTDKGLSIMTNSGNYNFTEENGLEFSKINALKVLSDDWVHIGTNGGGVSRLKYNGVDGITSASNIITTWSGLASDTVFTIYVTDDTLRWYGTTMGVSTHHGDETKNISNWWIYNQFTSDIIDNYVRAIVKDNEGNMWFGTRKGLSKLSTDKTTWKSFTEEDGLISNNIFDIKAGDNNNLWIATDKGVSLYSIIQTSAENEIVHDFKLNLFNYPNPFNPETKIVFSIPKTSNILLEVFDNLGRLVNVLVNERLNAGDHSAIFRTNNNSSGIYFYRLTVNKFSVTKKMILMK